MSEEDNNEVGSSATERESHSKFTTFEDYLATTNDGVRTLFDTHVSGLKSALEKERTSNKELMSKVKALASKAEVGSEMEAKLRETLVQLEEVQKASEENAKKATFTEQALQQRCTNIKAAYAYAVLENAFDKNGDPDWNKLKKEIPQLFDHAGRRTDAGAKQSDTSAPMNELIRRAAGLQ